MAMALSLPANFPQREMLVVTTFGVALFTLLVQGLTIEPLVRWMKVTANNVSKAIQLQQEIEKLEKEKKKLKEAGKTGQLSRKESKEKIQILDEKKTELEDLVLLLDDSQNSEDKIERIEIELALVRAQKECLTQLAKKNHSKPEILEQFRQRIDSNYIEAKAEPSTQESKKSLDERHD